MFYLHKMNLYFIFAVNQCRLNSASPTLYVYISERLLYNNVIREHKAWLYIHHVEHKNVFEASQ